MENNQKNQQNNTENNIISLENLWTILVVRLPVMLLAAVVVIGAMLAYNLVTFVPRYSSTATLYILKRDSDDNQQTTSGTTSTFNLAINVVKDCTSILKSHAVLDEVKQNLDLDTTYAHLAGTLSTNNPEDTRILEVTAESDTPEDAQRLVNEICEVGSKKIEEAMGFKQTNFIEEGILRTQPCNLVAKRTYAIAGFVAAAVVYAIYLVIFILDDSIRTNEDIEQQLGLTILGDIPNIIDATGGKYGYGKYGGKYYRKKKYKSYYRYGSKGKYGYGYGKGYGYGYGYGASNTENAQSEENAKENKKKEKK